VFLSLSECIDPSLREEICAGVTRHLGECAACREFVRTIRDTIRRIESQSSVKLLRRGLR
jgi:predicted anti-sigma-YlaC factor YlaD